MTGLGAFANWQVALGSHFGRPALALLGVAAALALVISALSLRREQRLGRALGLLGLRAGGVAACLAVALQPRLELGQMTRVPNHVAVLVDASRSMTVTPPDGGGARWKRAAAMIGAAAPLFSEWEQAGHHVELYALGDRLVPATAHTLDAEPKADATRIGEALSELRERAAGRELGAVVLLSDGVDTGRVGKGPLDGETIGTLKALGAPVHTVLVGERTLRDLSVASVLADDFAFVRTPIKLEALIRHSGYGGRQVEVTLTRDGRLIDSKSAALAGSASETKVSFDFVPQHPGNVVFEIATPVLAGEAVTGNNRQAFTLKVIRDRVRILHVCGRPSWDQRFLRSVLRLNPNVDLVSFFILRTEGDEQPWRLDEMGLIPFPHREIFQEQLRSFDLLIFQNFNYRPYNVEPFLGGVRDYVAAGGALAMIGGDLSFASGDYATSALRDLLPVELDGVPSSGDRSVTVDAFKPRLTALGRTHPATSFSLDPRANDLRWAGLPALEGINRVARLRPGAATLLAHPTLRALDGTPAPVLALAEVEKGRTLALLTDSAWHWAFVAAGAGDDGRAFQRFWEGAVRWLVRDPALTLLKVELDKIEVKSGQALHARVRTRHADFSHAAKVRVALDLHPADAPQRGQPQRAVEAISGAEGEAHVEFSGLGAGVYRLVGRATIDGRALEDEATFVVRPDGRELEDVVARPDVLREISEVTGGEFRDGSFGRPAVRKAREVRVGNLRTIEIWSHPVLLLVAIALLGAEWAIRRRSGHG